MSLRAAKKLQERNKTTTATNETDQPDTQGQEEEDQPKKAQKLKNAFAMFEPDDDDDNNDDDEEETNESKDKKGDDKKPEANSKKKDSKSQKKKKNKNKKKDEDEEDEEKKLDPEEEKKIDEILEEMRQEEMQKIENEPCLSINLKALNYNKELAKYFKGAKLTEKQEVQGRNARENKILKQMKNNRNKQNFKKFRLVHSDTTHMKNPERFECKKVGENEQKARIFAFEPTRKYLHLQEAYEAIKNTFDPNMILQFLRDNPYHIEALFDVAELMRTQGDYKQTNSLLENILMIYEDSLGYDCDIFESDDAIISYDENQFGKHFFLALNRFINVLGKKGCYKSALEFNKFLARLNPYQDPVGALLTLDYNAISCKNFDFLMNLPNKFGKEYYKSDAYSLIFMPNYIYSVGLCKLYKLTQDDNVGMSEYAGVTQSDFEKAIRPDLDPCEQNHNVNLMQAILLYPKVIREIINVNEFAKSTLSLGGDKFTNWQKKSFKDILKHEFMEAKHEYLYPCLNLNNNSDIEGLAKVIEIYIERSKLIWKNNKATMWIKACLGMILNQIEGGFNYEEFIEKMYTATFKYKVPFEMARYKGMVKSNFSDHVDRIDFANIPDVQGQAGGQNPDMQRNPINPNSGLLNLIFGSLLPWNHISQNNNNGQNNDDDSDSLPSDVEIHDEEL